MSRIDYIEGGYKRLLKKHKELEYAYERDLKAQARFDQKFIHYWEDFTTRFYSLPKETRGALSPILNEAIKRFDAKARVGK